MSIAIGMRSWEATSAHWRQRRRDVSESTTTGMAAVTCRRLELRPICLVIGHQRAVLFSHNKPATSNQLAVLFFQNKPAPAISQQATEHAP
jgi:hypothetical protein